MYRRLVVNLPDDAVGIMSDGIGQTVAVPKLIFTSICQQPHWCRDLRTDRTDLPKTRRSFSCCGCMLASLFIDEAHGGITVREPQTFNELDHLRTEEMTGSFVST